MPRETVKADQKITRRIQFVGFMPCRIRALLLFIKASLEGHPFHDGIVNEGLTGNPWFSHELENRRDRFRLDTGDAVEIGH